MRVETEQAGRVAAASIEPESVRQPVVRAMLIGLPWVLLVVIVIVLAAPPLRYFGKVMFTSGLLAATLSLFAFQALRHRIPETFDELMRREVLAGRPEDLGNQLNGRFQYVFGIGLPALVLLWYPWQSLSSLTIAAGFLLELLVAFVAGLMVWRMVVTGFYVWQLGRRNQVKPQLEHPDQCGGLEPLGNLCLWNAVVLSPATAYLAGWIVLGPISPYADLANIYLRLFEWLLLIPTGIAVLSFILPLWGIHEAMSASRAQRRRDLTALGKRIDEQAAAILKMSERTDPAKIDDMATRLRVMREVYRQNSQLPAWPINVGTLLKFVSSQILPAIGLLSQVVNFNLKALFSLGA